MDKKNDYIQLPYDYNENNDDEKLNFNLPKNFKKECYLTIYLLSRN